MFYDARRATSRLTRLAQSLVSREGRRPCLHSFECEKVAARPRRLAKEETALGCIFVLIALLSSRLALALVWIFTPWVDRAFSTLVWPILGIIFLPWTTLLYVLFWNTGGRGVTGWEWIFVILAVLVDVSSDGASARRRAAS